MRRNRDLHLVLQLVSIAIPLVGSSVLSRNIQQDVKDWYVHAHAAMTLHSGVLVRLQDRMHGLDTPRLSSTKLA